MHEASLGEQERWSSLGDQDDPLAAISIPAPQLQDIRVIEQENTQVHKNLLPPSPLMTNESCPEPDRGQVIYTKISRDIKNARRNLSADFETDNKNCPSVSDFDKEHQSIPNL